MKKFLLINFLLFLVIISVLEISARFFKLADIKGTDNIYKGKFLKTGSPLYQFLFGTYELEPTNSSTIGCLPDSIFIIFWSLIVGFM